MKLKYILICILFMGGAILASPVFASGSLIKTDGSPAVYYLDGNNIRHLFSTESTYKTWYKDFSSISILSQGQIEKYLLGENIRVRPGVNIVTFETDSNFYAVEPGGILRQFQNKEVIAEIYGDNWLNRVVKIQDGFFNDYSIGEKIKRSHQLPDGIVYKNKTNGQYFYKENGILQPFKDLTAVLDNNYSLEEITTVDTMFGARSREITGFDSGIFNPIAQSRGKTADCENKNLKVAFIFVTKETPTIEQINDLTKIKKRVAENFNWATREIAELDIDYPTIILSGDDDLLFIDEYDGQEKVAGEAINTFYDNNPDVFDFVILYNNFVLNEPAIANYLSLTNDFRGTGQSVRHSAYSFGSYGKLKGIVNMGNINKYSVDSVDNLDQSVNYVLHEIAHQWSGRAKFVDASGNISNDLLREPNWDHFNMNVDFISPLGGSGWIDNGDGTFTNKLSIVDNPNRKMYSELDLYFMGLLPKPFVSPIRYLVPSSEATSNNAVSGYMKEVTIDQIIDAMGEWSCKVM